MRPLWKPWTDEDILQLRKLHAAGASAARAAVALKKAPNRVRAKARELGIPFETALERKRRQRAREVEARTAAGLPRFKTIRSLVTDNPQCPNANSNLACVDHLFL